MRETLEELLHRQPFEPFEVRLSNGDAFQVKHPEFAMLLKSRLVIGSPESDRVVFCSLLHVANAQTLQGA
jgi:hypothetical protein